MDLQDPKSTDFFVSLDCMLKIYKPELAALSRQNVKRLLIKAALNS